ncbi:MAG: DNA repair protein RadC, partial [Longilinea sp.]|nr:DNA repair protein RadC [Longilinea sp.]
MSVSDVRWLAVLSLLRYSISRLGKGDAMRETPAAYRVSDMEANDRPRERLAEVGAENLSTAELLAILLRTGLPGENVVALAGRLLKDMGGLSGLHRSSLQELRDQHGLGLAKATQIKAAIELGRRLASEKPEDRPAITSPRDVADIVKYEMSAFTQEHLWVIVLDTRNRVIHIERLYKGSLNLAMVRVAEVLKPAI